MQVRQPWFSAAMDAVGSQSVDAAVVLAHMDLDPSRAAGEMTAIGLAVRARWPRLPLQFLNGHTHYRRFDIFDARTSALESGNYFNSLGLVRDICISDLVTAASGSAIIVHCGAPDPEIPSPFPSLPLASGLQVSFDLPADRRMNQSLGAAPAARPLQPAWRIFDANKARLRALTNQPAAGFLTPAAQVGASLLPPHSPPCARVGLPLGTSWLLMRLRVEDHGPEDTWSKPRPISAILTRSGPPPRPPPPHPRAISVGDWYVCAAAARRRRPPADMALTWHGRRCERTSCARGLGWGWTRCSAATPVSVLMVVTAPHAYRCLPWCSAQRHGAPPNACGRTAEGQRTHRGRGSLEWGGRRPLGGSLGLEPADDGGVPRLAVPARRQPQHVVSETDGGD
jgi:hypothetical protein